MSKEAAPIKPPPAKPICGIVMPISSIDGCSENHWSDVLSILSAAIDSAGFAANLVSNADDVGIIQKRIIQNLYENPVVVCDVSGKNPNVMFELGMRLAFDKPTIIVKDDKTTYSFDTSPIEHITYPRDLRFARIVDFKEQLKDKIMATHKAASENKKYTTFLKHFGTFTLPEIESKVVSKEDYILEEVRNLGKIMANLHARRDSDFPVRTKPKLRTLADLRPVFLCIKDIESKVDDLIEFLYLHANVESVARVDPKAGHIHLSFDCAARFIPSVLSKVRETFVKWSMHEGTDEICAT